MTQRRRIGKSIPLSANFLPRDRYQLVLHAAIIFQRRLEHNGGEKKENGNEKVEEKEEVEEENEEEVWEER